MATVSYIAHFRLFGVDLYTSPLRKVWLAGMPGYGGFHWWFRRVGY